MQLRTGSIAVLAASLQPHPTPSRASASQTHQSAACQLRVMSSDPALMTNVSPGNTVRAVSSVPNHQMFPEKMLIVSVITKPWMAFEELNGPNVIAAVFDALPAGDAAALKSAV